MQHVIESRGVLDEQTHNPSPARRELSGVEELGLKPKSILKRSKKADPAPKQAKLSSPTVSPVTTSEAIKNKLAEDDEEIAALEKKLGLKGKKN